jgi:tetratricopeptide (TPR) repeat protein
MTHGKRTLLMIAAAVVLDFGLTFAMEFFHRPDTEKIGVSVGLGVALIALTCWWASYDGAERNIRPPYAHMIVLYVTGLPYYLFRSRGFVKGLAAIIIAVAIWTVPSSLGAYAGWYAGRNGAFASAEWKQCFNGTTDDGIIANCTALIASTQDSATRGNALSKRALAYYHRGEYEKSLADYTQAVTLNHSTSSGFVGLCLTYAKMKDDNRALANCNEAVRLAPQSTNALLNRASIHYATRNYAGAIADYDQIIRLDTKSAKAFYGRGIAYQAKGDDEHAIADYSEAIRLKPDYAEAYGARGTLRRRKGDFDGAEDLAKFNSLRAR